MSDTFLGYTAEQEIDIVKDLVRRQARELVEMLDGLDIDRNTITDAYLRVTTLKINLETLDLDLAYYNGDSDYETMLGIYNSR